MSCYNDDELVAPSWINQKFLEDVLTKYENNGQVEIVKFDLSPASMKGDHYASVMFRCKVEYKFSAKKGTNPMQRSLIIKTLPEDGMKRDMLMESRLFETEIDMYTETLPKIAKILTQFGEPTKMSAGIFYHSLSPHKVIILEDLCELGYDTVRGRYLTEDELKAVYSKLAKLHAVSYMLGHSDAPEIVNKYQDGFMTISTPMIKELSSNGLRNFINLISSREEFAIYADKVKDIQSEVEQASKDLFRAFTLNNDGQGGDIFVLNHGDFHMKNLMFKFNVENQLEDMLMVDYQISCYAPSTIDLIYSQFMMLSPDLRLRRNEFMQYYFSEFIRILKKINFEGKLPKYSQFQMTSLKYRHFTLYLLAVMLPLVVDFMDKSVEELKDLDMKEMLENPESNNKNYELPAYLEELRRMMPVLLREGYLD